ncbi:MAG: UDP-N-acetylmuramoyl-tripeptide--D-alanyl-D-alanine ligase [Oleibacter sp.]|nr:UDP-N-acetylmuramoyl-tripeptide--D-alanyl-D-alanine ligase [Thalassolituus sp.]
MLHDLSLETIIEITSGKLIQNDASDNSQEHPVCQWVSTDTRQMKQNSLYIPLVGDRFDGHAFAQDALDAGATVMLAEREVNTKLVVIRVKSTLKALADIAAWQRQQFNGPVIGVTGSAGKTTVKQLTADVLSQQYNTWMTQGNLNNHIGVPLTLLALMPEHEAAMIEMGASGEGEIKYTAKLVCPKVGILTNVAAAHLEGFGDLETIVRTKGELIDCIMEDGVAVINRDEKFADQWIKRAEHLTIKTYGFSLAADYRAENIVGSITSSQFELHAENQVFSVTLPLPGEHNVRNALAVVAATRAIGMSFDQIINGLENAQGVAGRLQTVKGDKDQTIINDAYNANPTSMKAAIDVLAHAEKSWLVMGDMAELGENAEQMHIDVGNYAAQKKIQNFIATGRLSKKAADAFGENAKWFYERDEVIDYLNKITSAQDTILIKGSRSSSMDEVVRGITKITQQGEH